MKINWIVVLAFVVFMAVGIQSNVKAQTIIYVPQGQTLVVQPSYQWSCTLANGCVPNYGN